MYTLPAQKCINLKKKINIVKTEELPAQQLISFHNILPVTKPAMKYILNLCTSSPKVHKFKINK